ncbi:MAG: winged helix-turn-helix domain-containing protein [Pseudomonadota bacterium]|nr:winged helix-turn-helix domain-containing protein [Pseudomonadota bacterium]
MAQEKKLLLVTNEPIISDIFLQQLVKLLDFGIILIAKNVLDSYEVIKKNNLHFLILDSNVFDGKMLEYVSKYKSLLNNVPTMGLISKDLDKIKFLQKSSGLDDVLVKPFYVEDLVFSIRTILDKQREEEDRSVIIGEFCFVPHLKRLNNINKNKFINLTEKETSILSLLIKYKGKTVMKDKLLRVIWGYDNIIDTHTLETHVYRLRKKISKIESSFEVIKTTGGGYQIDK